MSDTFIMRTGEATMMVYKCTIKSIDYVNLLGGPIQSEVDDAILDSVIDGVIDPSRGCY